MKMVPRTMAKQADLSKAGSRPATPPVPILPSGAATPTSRKEHDAIYWSTLELGAVMRNLVSGSSASWTMDELVDRVILMREEYQVHHV